MTDIKKLRELAAKATKNVDYIAIEDTFPTMWFVDKKGENQDITNDDLIFWEKANPETVIALIDRIEKLELQLKEANEALSWYADEKNWEEVWMDFGGDDGRDGDVLARIDTDDCEVLDDELGMYFGSAGKRARAYLKKWEGEK